MNQALIEQFVKLIAQNTGLFIRPQDWLPLQRKLLGRVSALNLSSLEEYYQLLATSIYQKELELTGNFNSVTDNRLSPKVSGQTTATINHWRKLFFSRLRSIFLVKKYSFARINCLSKTSLAATGKGATDFADLECWLLNG